MTEKELIDFEENVAKIFNSGKCPYPIHLSGGNESQLISIYRGIRAEDWVFSTHRSHYHYLLKGGKPEKLMERILRGDSMHVYDRSINFFSSAIVAGCPSIAAGVAHTLRSGRVWCFVGDGAEAEGSLYEAVRWSDIERLPITYIIEDNGLSVDTETSRSDIVWPENVIRYTYKRRWPHVGTGTFVKEYK